MLINFNPDYALETLLRIEIAATSSVSSVFFLDMGVTISSSQKLAGTLDLIALSKLVTDSIG